MESRAVTDRGPTLLDLFLRTFLSCRAEKLSDSLTEFVRRHWTCVNLMGNIESWRLAADLVFSKSRALKVYPCPVLGAANAEL